ncbi:hypothetical protein V8F20_007436, partial [Naviculisporaceae sp. PSN 640]
PMTREEQEKARAAGMSVNYHGDPGCARNYSDLTLPSHRNTSFWIDRLPWNVTESEMFSAIRGCGRIDVLHINRGKAIDPSFNDGAAARLIFFTEQGAANCWARYGSEKNPGAFKVRGVAARVCRDRLKTPEHPDAGTPASRCIRMTGSKDEITAEAVIKWLRETIVFQLDEVVYHKTPDANMVSFTLRFARFSGQANLAYQALRRADHFRRLSSFQFWFDHDPCE